MFKAHSALAGGCALAAMALCSTSAHAADITDGLYFLNNHPDAAHAPPGYGLRLDDLIDLTSDKEVFTFDFDDSRSNMLMDVSGSTIRIFGVVFGGLDIGNEYDEDLSGLWELDFTYENVTQKGNDDDLWVRKENPTNTGSLTALFGDLGTFALQDYAGGHRFTIRIGDGFDDTGYRGHPGISAWGWLTHGDGPHIASSDFLFTATAVPVPPAVLLGAAGLAGIAGLRWRRRKLSAAE